MIVSAFFKSKKAVFLRGAVMVIVAGRCYPVGRVDR